MGKRFAMCISGLLSGAIPQVAWAEGAGGSYRGIATLYHFFIALILIYGVNDIFGKKVMYFIAPVILVTMYFVAEYVSA